MGKASLDWTSLLSLHKSLGARTFEITPQKSSSPEFQEMRTLQDRARASGTVWMRGQDEPGNWERRHEIPMNSWH